MTKKNLNTTCPCSVCKTQPQSAEATHHRDLLFLLRQASEKQRRQIVAMEVRQYGEENRGKYALITGLNEKTIQHGMTELQKQFVIEGERQPGAGRKEQVEKKTL